MRCSACQQENTSPSGILIQGSFYCVDCSRCLDNLCDESTPDEIKGYLSGQTAVLALLKDKHNLVEAGSIYDSYKQGRREGTALGVQEENARAVNILETKLHNDSFGGCYCKSCENIRLSLQELDLSA